MIVGVDEAGKGPVLGSMFAAAVRVPSVDRLPDGIRDSKALSPGRRGELAGAIRDRKQATVGLAEVTPARIDRPDTDMNALTVAGQAEALAGVVADGDRVIADAGEVDAARFARRLAERIDASVDVTAEHGADAAHAVVGAASIVAKVERDAHVDRLAGEYGAVGSGYPSDPVTREFLRSYVRDHGELPACARSSWRTCEDVLAAASQSTLDSF